MILIRNSLVLNLNKMWEYKITKSWLWYNIYKKKEIDWLLYVYFLGKEDERRLWKQYARTFYHKEDAMSHLTLARYKDGKSD